MRLPAPPKKSSPEWVLQLINIVFLLLLFFIVNGTIAKIQDPTILPPRAITVTTGKPLGDAAYIDASGTLKFRGDAMTPAAIHGLLGREAAAGLRPTYLQIVADRRLNAARLVELLQEFRAQGFENLSLVTMREQGQ